MILTTIGILRMVEATPDGLDPDRDGVLVDVGIQ